SSSTGWRERRTRSIARTRGGSLAGVTEGRPGIDACSVRRQTWRRSPWIGCVRETVADAPLGQDVTRVGRVVLELLAQIVDVKPNIMRGVAVLRSPDATEQDLVGHDHARIGRQLVQKPELGRP